jgi:hypothetical protein
MNGVTLHSLLTIAVLGIPATGLAQSTCTSAPPPPANAAASETSPPLSAQGAALVTVQWIGVPTTGPAAVTSYAVEVGTAPGLADVVIFDTGSTAVSTVQPATSGTYYVRVRSVNACGKSGPSPEPAVVVNDAAASGSHAVRRTASFFGDDGFGDLYAVGELRGAWGSAPTGFVEVRVAAFAADGSQIDSGYAYVLGRSRRATDKRYSDDSTLAAGETGCYAVWGDIPLAKVDHITTTVSWSDSAFEPLRGSTIAQKVAKSASSLGLLKVEGEIRNVGTVLTYYNEAMMDVHDLKDQLLGCDYADNMVGGEVPIASGGTADRALQPNQIGAYYWYFPHVFSNVGPMTTWTGWDEADAGPRGLNGTLSWRAFTSQIPIPAATDAAERARRRNRAIDQLRQVLEAGAGR